MGVPSTMALKTVLLLALVGLVYSLSCSGDRDCTCADKAFGECDEPGAGDAVHVNTWQECKAQCDLFFSKDDCGGYVESECAKKGIEVDTADTPLPNADACQLVMISRASANALTYYTYDVRAKVCKGYGDGARACDNQVALQTMDEALINSCQT